MILDNEKKWVIVFSLLVILITTLPYLLGYFRQGEEWRFTGFIINIEDGNSYLAKMIRGSAGDWLFKTPYSAYPQQGFISFLPYLLLGKLMSAPNLHDQAVALFHIFRCCGIFFLAYTSYSFIAHFISDLRMRRLATIFCVMGGGAGWLSLVGLSKLWAGRIPVEFYSPEAFGFLMVFDLPHLCFSRGFLLIAVKEFFIKDPKMNINVIMKKGLPWSMIGIFQPLTIISGWLLIAAQWLTIAIWHSLKNRKWELNSFINDIGLKNTIIAIGFSLPFVLYNFLSFQLDPYLKGWFTQNILISPPVSDYLLAYLPYLPLALWGIIKLYKENIPQAIFIGLSIILLISAAYIPYNLQRRLLEGVFVLLIISSFIGIKNLQQKWTMPATLLLSNALIPTIVIVIGSIISIWKPRQPLYMDTEKSTIFEEFNSFQQKDSIVLASYENSNQIPSWSPVFTLIGHGPESANLGELKQRIRAFYNVSSTEESRQALLNEFNIHYLIYGPEERKLGDWDPNSFSGLEVIFSQGNYQVFQIEE